MRTVLVIFVFSVAIPWHAQDAKWERTSPVKSEALLGAVATQSITSGGCTATAQGSNLSFTCPETAWRVRVRNTSKGLQISRGEFRRTPQDNFMTIVYEANIAEIFVPYHDGDPNHRLYDTQYTTATNAIRSITAQDVDGVTAELVTLPGDTVPTAAIEIRDRGIAWLCKFGAVPQSGSISRRGKEMAVWGVFDTGNYEYLIEYTFRDDGQLGFRLGATGYDNPNKDYQPGLAHMHDILWRVDLDLNGSSGDSAFVDVHNELAGLLPATDQELPFNGGNEGGIDLAPLYFSTLVIEDSSVNKRGNHFGYELQPFGKGQSRHAEAFCQDDVWVTRWKSSEPAIPANWTPPNDYLIGNAQNTSGIYDGASISNQDLVLWHSSPIHHEPHDEDQSPTDTGKEFRGLTLTHWTGFDLVPHNLFDYNPLGAPDRSACE